MTVVTRRITITIKKMPASMTTFMTQTSTLPKKEKKAVVAAVKKSEMRAIGTTAWLHPLRADFPYQPHGLAVILE